MSPHGDLFRSLGVLCERPGPRHERIAALLGVDGALDVEAYTELFVLQCHPYESVYSGPEGMLGGEGADQVAGFYRAIGLAPPAEADHLASLLGLYGALVDSESSARGAKGSGALRMARQALLVEHLLSWVPVFLDAVRLNALALGAQPYAQWALLVADVLACEAHRLDRPVGLPRALRVAPGPPVPADQESLVSALLAPLRSGIVLSRLDLLRAGRQTGTAGRVGERRFTLTSMLGQDPVEVLSWLAVEAASWESRHLARASHHGEVALWWAGRAASTSKCLAEAAEVAAGELAFSASQSRPPRASART